MKKAAIALLVLILALVCLVGCTQEDEAPVYKQKNAALDTETPVVLTMAGGWNSCPAFDRLSRMFTERFPNVTLRYEMLQDYVATLPERLGEETLPEDAVDLFFTFSLQPGVELYDGNYALELMGQSDALDLSKTFPGLIDNFSVTVDGSEDKLLYSVPVGGDLRALFVNVTLLKSLNIAVPTNLSEFLAACETLKNTPNPYDKNGNGYVALHGNPSFFAQRLMYPYYCNVIANADDATRVWNDVNDCAPGVSEYFREPTSVLYNLVAEGYYNYKYAQEALGLFTSEDYESCARDFFDIAKIDGDYEKRSDLGQIAFMPGSTAQIPVMDEIKKDYHSEIEYAFILAPLGEDGGFAYMSPANGIAINRRSLHTDWALEFLNFLFTPENNEIFAEEFHCSPNTADAFVSVSKMYDVPEDHVSHLGQATFEYNLYKQVLNEPFLVPVSKWNNPKYANPETGKMYTFDDCMAKLEALFVAQREAMEKPEE